MRAAHVFGVACLWLAAVSAGCGPGGLHATPPETAGDTTLGAGDEFEVRVYGESDLTINFRVAQDGTIDYPYVGRVEVLNLQPTEVADLLQAGLLEAEVLIDPQVSVLVTEYNSKRISVVGAVNNPGNFPISPGLTTLQAVVLAGGPSELANTDEAVLTRRVDGRMRRYSLQLNRLRIGTAEDFEVRNGDIIFVPARPF